MTLNIPPKPDEFDRVEDPILKRALSSVWSKLTRTVNGRIGFGSPQNVSKGLKGNVDGTWPGTLSAGYTITTPGVANTEFTVTHNLGRVPTGYDVKSIDAAANVYDSRKALWTKTQMFLKCNQATVHLVLFVH